MLTREKQQAVARGDGPSLLQDIDAYAIQQSIQRLLSFRTATRCVGFLRLLLRSSVGTEHQRADRFIARSCDALTYS
jgi:hypothetical protein